MCWMTLAKPGTKIPSSWIKEAASTNRDGGGYCFAHDGKLVVRKPFPDVAELIKAYKTDFKQYGHMSSFALHLRFGTSGKKEGDLNCHPHISNEDEVALLHNGILSVLPPSKYSHYSDTAWFNHVVLDYRGRENIFNDPFKGFLEDAITPSNKFILMDCLGQTMIVHEKSGSWENNDTIWVSNHGHKRCCTVVTHGYNRQQWFGTGDGDYDGWYGNTWESAQQIDELKVIRIEGEIKDLEEKFQTATMQGDPTAEDIKEEMEWLICELEFLKQEMATAEASKVHAKGP